MKPSQQREQRGMSDADIRATALELAIASASPSPNDVTDFLLQRARKFETFLRGDAGNRPLG